MSPCVRTCSGQHEHVPLEGGRRTRLAERYPDALIAALAMGVEAAGWVYHHPEVLLARSDCDSEEDPPSFPAEVPGDEGESDQDEPETRPPPRRSVRGVPVSEASGGRPSTELEPALQQEVHKLHVNLGHPNRSDFLRTLRVARAREDVLKWVKEEFRCSACEAHARPHWRRHAHIPRTYQFNKVVAVDLFYIEVDGHSAPVLNIIDHGTSYQQACLLPNDTALVTWRAFLQ
eukprot:4196715-Pyramimonas_sp.AAC.1